MFQRVFLLLVSYLLLVGIVSASDNPVYILTKVEGDSSVFDPFFQVARLTAGTDGVADHRLIRIPLSADLTPVLPVPPSDHLSRLLSSLSGIKKEDGSVIETGDLYLEFAVSKDSYTVVVVSNVHAFLAQGLVIRGAVISHNDADLHISVPVVKNLPVVSIAVDHEFQSKLVGNTPVEDTPSIGDFVLAQVSLNDSSSEYRIIAVYLRTQPYVWLSTIERRSDEEIVGDRGQYTGSSDRPISVSVPATYIVRPLAVMPLEERLQMWLDGKIAWDETNCFTLEGECYRQGYNGETLNTSPYHDLVGTLLGSTKVGEDFFAYIGFTSSSGERYFLPFYLGTYRFPNGLGVVVQAQPTIEGNSDMITFTPWRKGVDIDLALNPYIGSPILAAIKTRDSGYNADFAEHIELQRHQYGQAAELAEYVFGVTNQNMIVNSNAAPWFLNTIIYDDNMTSEMVMIASLTFGRYV